VLFFLTVVIYKPMMTKKEESRIIMKTSKAPLLLIALSLLASCGESVNESAPSSENTATWLPESVLKQAGLAGLPSPQATTNLSYTNDGIFWVMSFQEEGSKELLDEYSLTVFSYFSTDYAGKFGKENIKGSGTRSDTMVFYSTIVAVNAASELYSTNPSPKYDYYYLTKEKEEGSSFYPSDSVFSLDIRFEDGLLKLFVTNANPTNGTQFYS
jgi:hypothetical protein